MSEVRWFGPALGLVAALTALRIAALAASPTDLFVDESQYWLWGQTLGFGYYSKPPLVAWVIRLSTDIGGDTPFWVRMPAPLFHAATAMILGAISATLFGARSAFWTALGYATLPLASWGSFLISTDSIMAPFFALALLFWLRALGGRGNGWAAASGLAIGMAALAKYAAVYFLIGVALAALRRDTRPTPAQAAALLLAFALVIAPNAAWNLTHGLSTVEHTMDNVGWIRGLSGLHPGRLAEFVLAQFGVFGPVLFAALLWQFARPLSNDQRRLRPFSWPPLLLVSVQAVLSKAYANWAVAAYFAGTLIAVPALLRRAPGLLWLSMAINTALALLVTMAVVLADDLRLGRDRPLLDRYLGRADLSRQILDAARANGAAAVFAGSRDILADLSFTGAGSGLPVYAPRPLGRPGNYYEETRPLPADPGGPVLAVLAQPPVCNGAALAPVGLFDTAGGAYAGDRLAAYLVLPGCFDALG